MSATLWRMQRRLLIGGIAATLALAACTPAPDVVTSSPAVTASGTATEPIAPLEPGVYAIECGADEHLPTSVRVLGPDHYRVGGWNHVNGVGSFENVALESREYAISAKNYLEDPSCDGAKTLQVVLAKKTYDWDKQHANGLESQFPGEELTFGQVESIVLELRIDMSRSVLPQAADYEERYGDLLTPEQLAELDGGKVNLELTLFGSGATADQPFMNAGTIIEVDPGQFGDGWIRVKVPREELTFYTEKNYERTPVGEDEHQDLLVKGLRINPETSSGNEVRVYVGDAFDPQGKPELFKEMALSFYVIEVERSAP